MGRRERRRVSPEVKRARVYRERNRILAALGFPSYQAYLKSETWHSLRAFVLKQNPKCFACGGKATQVHHTIYTKPVLEGKSERGLIATCGACHYEAEFRRSDGEKLRPRQATIKLKQMKAGREKERAAFVDWFTGGDNEQSF